MPRTALPIPLGFYQSQSSPLSVQRCINWEPTIPQGEALNNRALLQGDGVTLITDSELGKGRGSIVVNGVFYSVNGNALISVSSSGVVTNYGTISGSARVSLAANNPVDDSAKIVIVVPAGDAYSFDTDTGVITKITDFDFLTSDSVNFHEGYFVFTATNGKQFFVSNLNQPLVFDAIDVGTAERSTDDIVTSIVDHGELTIVGVETSEVFSNIGGVGFPYQIIPGAYTEKGAHSKYGVIQFDSSYLFIGGGKNELSSIWRQTSSSQATKISTDAIDNAIQKFTKEEISQAFAMTMSRKGQLLCVFTFESSRIAGKTFVYNATTSALAGFSVWYELQSGMTDNSWRVNSIAKVYGKFLVTDAIDGRIGFLDDSVFTEYGEAVKRQMVTAPFSQNGTAIFAGEFEATFQAGVGLNNGQGSRPVAIMDYSDDGGHSFSNDFKREIGAIGEYGQETIWNRQGRFPNSRSIRLTVTDPVSANLIRLAATPELGYD